MSINTLKDMRIYFAYKKISSTQKNPHLNYGCL